MIRFVIILGVFSIVSCSKRIEQEPDTTLSESEIEELLSEWRKDSLGCLRTRDVEKMKIYAKQLVGKDSLELIKQLGSPNHRYGETGERHFYYVLECPKDRPSYHNFYFHFNRDTIGWFSNPVLN